MNLGQAFGIDKLRIWQLEDELERRRIRLVPAHIPTVPGPEAIATTRINEAAARPRRGYDRGIGSRVHAALPEGPPGLMLGEIADRLPDVHRPSISAFLVQFDDVERDGERGKFRYYRKAAA